MAKKTRKKRYADRLFAKTEREKFIDDFVDGAILEAQEDSGKGYNDIADKLAPRLHRKLQHMSDVQFIRFAFGEWEELAEKHFGHKAQWMGVLR